MTAEPSAVGEFFSAFWPNFAATVLGVILAIPPALWLVRIGERDSTEPKQAGSHRRCRLSSRHSPWIASSSKTLPQR